MREAVDLDLTGQDHRAVGRQMRGFSPQRKGDPEGGSENSRPTPSSEEDRSLHASHRPGALPGSGRGVSPAGLGGRARSHMPALRPLGLSGLAPRGLACLGPGTLPLSFPPFGMGASAPSCPAFVSSMCDARLRGDFGVEG